MQNQGSDSLNFENFEELLKSSSFFSPLPNIPLAQNPFQMPNWPQVQGFVPSIPPTPGNIPALGLYREWQEDFTHLMLLQQQLAECQKNYIELFSKFSQNVTDRLKSQLTEVDQQDLTFDLFCRVWIDCCEDEFQVISSSSAYSKAYGALIDATMRLLQHSYLMQDKNARINNIPTRSEIAQLHASQAMLKDHETKLHERIGQLEEQIGELKRGRMVKTRTSTTRKKTVAKTKGSTAKG